MLTATEFDLLARARDELRSAGRGQRAPIIARVAGTLGVSTQTAYRKLADAGFDSGRKRRVDAGESMLAGDHLQLVAGVLAASLNKKGQRMPVATAIDILRASGQLPFDVSESTVARQLYQHHLHPEQLALPSASVQMVSRHPNHVWQVDSTTGAYYYLPGGRLRWMPEEQFYKNKVENIVKASTDLLTRYAAADHTTHAFRCRYYLGGETIENLMDFITWAMWKDDSSPMHGLPLMMVMDPGPANKSQPARNFFRATGIHAEWHASGAANVTGSVEKVHDLARMHFETRFRFKEPAEVTLDKLNAELQSWAAAYCSTRVHSRHKRTRYGAWMEIRPEELRVAASLEVLREAAMREPETRRVSNERTVTFAIGKGKTHTYDLRHVPGTVPGLRVTMQLNVFRSPAIDVLFTDPDTGAQTWHVVEPAKEDAWGYRDGPVWGEDMRTAANSVLDDNRNAVTKQAYKTGDGLPTLEEAAKARKAHAAAYAGVIDPMADVKATQVPSYLPRHSTPVELPQRQVEARRFDHYEAAKIIRDRTGPAYTPQVYGDLVQRFPDGVNEAQIDLVCAELTAPPPAAEDGLRLIGGGAA